MLINGQWAGNFHPVQGTDDNGGFVRKQSQFRNWITPDGRPGPTGEGGFVAEPDRYHLYVTLICPWASRTLMVRQLKGLEDIVSVTVLDPRLTDKVWRFGDDFSEIPNTQPDPLYGAEYLYQIYLRARSDYTGRITVPVLWDKHRETIVNNESADIIRIFNDGLGQLAGQSIDLYPLDLRDEIDDVNERLYENFNNGVYRAGFATTQIAYEQAVQDVFDSLDWIDRRLDGQDYLVGDQLTEADVRAFVTLIRVDLAYHGLFKTNLHQLGDYRNITAYMKRIYDLPDIADTVSPEHIKAGYYSIRALNPSGIVPVGPGQLW